MELVIGEGSFEDWTKSAGYCEAIGKFIEEAQNLLTKNLRINDKVVGLGYVRGFIAAVSNWAIKDKNKPKVLSYIGLLDRTSSEMRKELADAPKKMLEGMKSLAEDYSNLFKENWQKYDDSNGSSLLGVRDY